MRKTHFRISEFAEVSGIPRKTLIFYDKIGLLPPAVVDGENGYRYYSYRQFDTASVISALREVGMPLKEIQAYLARRTPEAFTALCVEQQERLTAQITRLTRIRAMLRYRMQQAQKSLAMDEYALAVVGVQAENLFIGPPLPVIENLNDGFMDLPAFYEACMQNGIEAGLPVGSIVEEAHIARRSWRQPAYYFCTLPANCGYPQFYEKPAGSYLVGYAYTDYGFTDGLYERLFSYIDEHALTICGAAYEEYLLDEVAEKNPERYLLEIAIQVDTGVRA